jgi:ABC-2 type transport system permease protein
MTAATGAAGSSPRPTVTRRPTRGLGSIFGKTIRDSRRATIAVGAILGLVLVAVSYGILSEFSTPESRRQIDELIRAVPPIMQGLAGKPVNVGTLGGYMSYKYGTFFPLIVSLWSMLALSGTLAAEARRGSLEFIAVTGRSRRRIALEKLAGHVVMLGIAMAFLFVAIVIAGNAFEGLPGDRISVESAAAYTAWLGLLSLAAGSVAWAAAPFLGRGAAVGIAGAVTFAGFLVSGYQAAIPEIGRFANLTWWGWTSDHVPLAGQFDYPPLGLVALVTLGLLVVGIEAFARRDVGVTSAIPIPGLPDWLVGIGGPARRAFGDAISITVSWGVGLGIFGLVIAGSGSGFADQLKEAPDFLNLLQTVFPNVDFGSSGWFLQLLFVEFGLILAGLAAATLVARWASDETSGRLEFLLATPLGRARWVFAGWLAILAGLAVIVAMTAAGILAGSLITGGDVATPMIGTVVLGLFAAAMAGIGLAVGGLLSSGIAALVVVAVTLVMWFVDVVGPPLGLPDVIHDLALQAHYGQPMLGEWDAGGVIASLVLAAGGLAIGAFGFSRRDLRG